jgi:hypothetical protein
MAVSEQPGRYERSPSGMVGALIATLLVVGAYVGFRALNRTPLDVHPQHVDYLVQVHYAQQAGAQLAYPPSLPTGWYATNLDYTPSVHPEMVLSMLTGSRQYVGLVQSATPLPQLLTTYVDPSPTQGSAVTLSSAVAHHWSSWTDSGGDTALAAQWNHETLMVFGTASRSELEQVARSLTTRRAARG